MQPNLPTTSDAATGSRARVQRVGARFGGWLQRNWGLVVTAVAVTFFFVTGRAGIDFGFHWDEPVQLRLVNNSIAAGTLLPDGFYNYPSATYALSLASVAGTVFEQFGRPFTLTGDDFFLQARTLFLAVSALGGLWIYFALRPRTNNLVAALSACVFLSSWQLAYHARWIAPDAIMASAVALFLWALLAAVDAPAARLGRHLCLLAVSAGLVAGVKYQGALLLAPALVVIGLSTRRTGASTRLVVTRLGLGVVAFAATFVAVTPGVVLQPRAFLGDVRFEMDHYATTHGSFKGAMPYDVDGPIAYLGKLASYVFVSLPSDRRCSPWS